MKPFDWLDQHPALYWFPVLGIIAIILFFSLIPMPFTAVGMERGDLLNFDILHIIAYFTLSFFIGIAFKHSRNNILSLYHYSFAVLIGITFGTLIELAQGLIPGRYPSFIDAIYNSAGVVLAQILRYLLEKVKQSLQTSQE